MAPTYNHQVKRDSWAARQELNLHPSHQWSTAPPLAHSWHLEGLTGEVSLKSSYLTPPPSDCASSRRLRQLLRLLPRPAPQEVSV